MSSKVKLIGEEMMDEKLKAKLIAKIDLAQAELKGTRRVKEQLEGQGRKTSLSMDEKRPQNALFNKVKRKLLKERLWFKTQAALVRIGFDLIVREFNRKAEAAESKAALSAAREKQLELFPGFENLPTRIQSGRTYLKFPDLGVARFLAYEARYQTRAQRNQQTADELHRLAVTVKPFEEVDPEMPVATAFSRAQSEPAKLAIVVPKKA